MSDWKEFFEKYGPHVSIYINPTEEQRYQAFKGRLETERPCTCTEVWQYKDGSKMVSQCEKCKLSAQEEK